MRSHLKTKYNNTECLNIVAYFLLVLKREILNTCSLFYFACFFPGLNQSPSSSWSPREQIYYTRSLLSFGIARKIPPLSTSKCYWQCLEKEIWTETTLSYSQMRLVSPSNQRLLRCSISLLQIPNTCFLFVTNTVVITDSTLLKLLLRAQCPRLQ